MSKNDRIKVVQGIFWFSILMSNILASNLIDVWGWNVTAGIIMYPLSYLCSDIINEVKGKKDSYFTITMGFVLSVFLVFVTWINSLLHSVDVEIASAYHTIFSFTPRIVAGSMIAYLLSQYWDVIFFSFLKKLSGGKHLWLRNNLSTLTSQALDTLVFTVVAFWGIYPAEILQSIFIAGYVLKVIIVFLDTPLCYAGVALVKKGGNEN